MTDPDLSRGSVYDEPLEAEAICENCKSWARRGHMVAAGGAERHYGTCMNSANDVSLSVGWEQSTPMHDMRWSWATCPHFAAQERP